MKTEYRMIFTATFDTATERDKAYASLKSAIASIKTSATFKRADMSKDEYSIQDTLTVSEKVI